MRERASELRRGLFLCPNGEIVEELDDYLQHKGLMKEEFDGPGYTFVRRVSDHPFQKIAREKKAFLKRKQQLDAQQFMEQFGEKK
jgi:hypothetical protein